MNRQLSLMILQKQRAGKKAVAGFLSGLFLFSALLIGCQPQQPIYLHSRGDVASQYISEATKIDYPNTHVESLDDVKNVLEPLTLKNPDPKEEWLLSLDDVRRMTLENSKVLRQLSSIGFSAAGTNGTPSMLLSSPAAALTVYDPAITEANPQAGVAAALSAFDAVWSSTVSWNKANTPRNSGMAAFMGNRSDTGTFQTSLAKKTATGGSVYITHGQGYDWSDASNRTWPSAWSTYLEAGFSQPLLRGAGIEYNQIAGPNGAPGSSNGVLIARINEDLALVDFEMGVRNTLKDLEENYWNLYYAYRYLSATGAGLEASLQSWRQTKAQYDVGHRNGTAQNLSQAEQNYTRFWVSVQEAQNNLYKTEQYLRYMIGIAASDGRLIKPTDEPTIAKVKYNWDEIVNEALTRAPEIRRQKWEVKKYELQLIAQRNYLLPQLDLNGSYNANGLGHDLIDPSNHRSNAYGSMTSGDYYDLDLGLTMRIAIGYRQEMAAVRHAELMLSRSRVILQEQENELVHNLSELYRDVTKNYELISSYLAVLRAAQREVRAVEASYQVGNTTLYEVLQAQQKLSDAETNYYWVVVQYNLAIMNLNYRKGSLLEYNGVTLAEGVWPNKAYFDATRRARARDAARPLNYAITDSQIVSRGTFPQIQGTDPTIIPATERLTKPGINENSQSTERTGSYGNTSVGESRVISTGSEN